MRSDRLTLLASGAGFGVVALTMLVQPRLWYEIFPDVAASGPFNAHFVRDLGAAFLVAATGFVLAAINPSRFIVLAGAGTALLVLHALIHAAEAVLLHSHADSLAAIATVYAPAAIAAIATVSATRGSREARLD